MPYKKELAKKRKLSPSALAYLSDGEVREEEDTGSLWCLRYGMPGFFEDNVEPKELWEKYRDEFLPEFIEKHPGEIPWPWWQFESPGNRERIGGHGILTWEKWPAVLPTFQKGIPSAWDSINEEDPPLYESEAAYLLRHDLLSPQEKKYVTGHPQLLKPEILKIYGD